MFSVLTTCYLFLGGAGAGALVVLGALECANARRRFATQRGDRGRFERAFALPDELFSRGWPLCFVALSLGMLCLLVDLGRPDRLLGLVVSPELSAISVGAYSLAIALACAGAFSLASLLDSVRMGLAAVYVLAGVGMAAGVVTMTYSGALLQSLASVLFWQTPLLPLLFVLSAASCGIACVFLAAAFVEARQPFVRPLVLLARIDGAIILAEALCLAAYLLLACAGDGTRLAVEALVAGAQAPLFWGGIVVGGMVLPFSLERFITHGNSRTQFLWIAALLLMGGFVLRFCIVGAAAYDITQMPEMLYGLGLG